MSHVTLGANLEPGQELMAPPHWLKAYLNADLGFMDNRSRRKEDIVTHIL